MSEQFKQSLAAATEDFKQHVSVVAGFDHKIGLIAEGQQMLAERMDRMEERLDNRIDQVEKRLGQVEVNLTKKIDLVVADLSAHRADTEAHHGVYRVKEIER